MEVAVGIGLAPIVEHCPVAVSKTEWGRRGFRLKNGETPHAILSAHFNGSMKTWPVYRDDQVCKKKTPTVIPPKEIPLLQALWRINRYAKRCRDAASRYYEAGCHGFAGAASRTKVAMYVLKSQALHYLLRDGIVRTVGIHKFPGGVCAEVVKGGDYTFHRPCPPQETIEVVLTDEIEAKPRSVAEPRLKDAIQTIQNFLGGKPNVDVYKWPATFRPSRSQLRNWDNESDDGDDLDQQEDWDEEGL